MKTIQTFQCEICKTIYNTEEDAKKCEKKHPRDIEIVDLVFDEHRTEPTTVVLKWGKTPGMIAIGAKYTLGEFITKESEFVTKEKK